LQRILRLLIALAIIALPVAASASTGHTVYVADGDAPGSFEVVGHDPLMNRGMNAAPAVKGDYAYIGSRTDAKAGNQNHAGVFVVDIHDPSSPKIVTEIGPPDEGNEGETSRELRIWPQQNLLIVENLGSNCSYLIHECSPRAVDDHFSFYDISGKNAAAPKLVSTYTPSMNPHEFYLWLDPKRPGRALMFISTPGGGKGQMMVTDITHARDKKFTELATWQAIIPDPQTDNRLHSLSVSPDGKTGYVAYLGGGSFLIDTSDFANAKPKPEVRLITPLQNRVHWGDPGAHSAVPIWGQDYYLTTDEVYGDALKAISSGGGCPWGWARTVDIHNPEKPKVVAEYKLPQNEADYCQTDPPRPSSSYSSHNPTLTQHIAFVTWHSGGLQAIDLTDPTKPTEAAGWVPDPEPYVVQEDPALSAGQDKVVVWSYPIIQNGLIYVVDIRNGLYILRYKGPYDTEVARTKFLEGNSNLGDALRLGKL
jgi:hypothetical protein